MHTVRNNKPIDMGVHGILPPGYWLADDINAFELGLLGQRGDVRLSRVQPEVAGASPIIIRPGAWGDLLLLTPALKVFKDLAPGRPISLSCFPKHFELFEDSGLVDRLVPYPTPYADCGDWLALENVMELAHDTHATDAFAKALGVTVTDYKPIYVVTETERMWAEIQYPRTEKKRIGLQLRASVPTRDYPVNLWMQVVKALLDRGHEVFFFGAPGQLPPVKDCPPNVFNLSQDNLTFRQSAAVLKTCDVFAGPDSALVHLCHALDVPAVGLYGPFPWEIRTGKAPLTRALSGSGACAPCYWHKHAGKHFPPDCPTAKHGFCGVLASIPPQRIVSKIEEKL